MEPSEPSWWYCKSCQVSWHEARRTCFVCSLIGLSCWSDPYNVCLTHIHRGGCWADKPHSFQSDVMVECGQPGTGRLGLCPTHEGEILGMCHVSDVDISKESLISTCV